MRQVSWRLNSVLPGGSMSGPEGGVGVDNDPDKPASTGKVAFVMGAVSMVLRR